MTSPRTDGSGDHARLHSLAGFALVRVRGRSMEPTLREGDVLLVRRNTQPNPGDIVIVRLPGERPLAVKRGVRRENDGWWVERDNPREGVDSWSLGAIADRDVVARVVTRIWPPRRSPPTQ